MAGNSTDFAEPVNGFLTGWRAAAARPYFRSMRLAEILQRIEGRLAELEMSEADAAKASGKSDAIRNIRRAVREGRDAGVSTQTLDALAAALKTTPAWLVSGGETSDAALVGALRLRARRRKEIAAAPPLRDESPQAEPGVPIRFVAAGSAIAAFVIAKHEIGLLPRPPGLAHVADAYAIYVQNDSMAPMHSQGDLRFVHPHKPPRPGDSVIVRLKNGEAYIKLFAARSEAWIVCRQLNPAAQIKFALAQVEAVHHVMTTGELFGA
jgi:phage repressor protein C with HTH and peptisase S24 domain